MTDFYWLQGACAFLVGDFWFVFCCSLSRYQQNFFAEIAKLNDNTSCNYLICTYITELTKSFSMVSPKSYSSLLLLVRKIWTGIQLIRFSFDLFPHKSEPKALFQALHLQSMLYWQLSHLLITLFEPHLVFNSLHRQRPQPIRMCGVPQLRRNPWLFMVPKVQMIVPLNSPFLDGQVASNPYFRQKTMPCFYAA